MVYLLAVENGVEPVRATDDVDVAVNVRAKPGGTEWLAGWLVGKGFELQSVSADNIGHRFVRDADPGPGQVVFDILAPEGGSARARRRSPAGPTEQSRPQALRRHSDAQSWSQSPSPATPPANRAPAGSGVRACWLL